MASSQTFVTSLTKSSSIVFKSFVMVKRFNVKSPEWKLERKTVCLDRKIDEVAVPRING